MNHPADGAESSMDDATVNNADEPSELRLINLSTGEQIALTPGMAIVIEGAFRITPADDLGNAMIERLAKARERRLLADGAMIYELAHVRPGQLIETDLGSYVLLRRLGVFVRLGGAPEARLTRWRELATRTRQPALLTPGRITHDTPPASTKALRPPTSAGHPTDRPRTLRLPRTRRIWVLGSLTAGLLLSMVAIAVWARSDLNPSPPMSRAEPQSTDWPQAAKASPERPPPPQQTPVRDAVPATPVPVLVAEPVTAPRLSRIPRPRMRQSPPPAPPREAPVYTSVERQIRSQVETLLLEANDDPHKAREQLRQLLTQVPAGSGLHHEIDQALKNVP